MLQPIQQVEPPKSMGQFIAILCEGQFERFSETEFPLGTPVTVPVAGIIGVISSHSPNDAARIRVSWFDRTDWIVRHRFYDRGVVQRLESKTAASA